MTKRIKKMGFGGYLATDYKSQLQDLSPLKRQRGDNKQQIKAIREQNLGIGTPESRALAGTNRDLHRQMESMKDANKDLEEGFEDKDRYNREMANYNKRLAEGKAPRNPPTLRTEDVKPDPKGKRFAAGGATKSKEKSMNSNKMAGVGNRMMRGNSGKAKNPRALQAFADQAARSAPPPPAAPAPVAAAPVTAVVPSAATIPAPMAAPSAATMAAPAPRMVPPGLANKPGQMPPGQYKKMPPAPVTPTPAPMMKTMKSGGLVRGNGCAQRGKTRGRMV